MVRGGGSSAGEFFPDGSSAISLRGGIRAADDSGEWADKARFAFEVSEMSGIRDGGPNFRDSLSKARAEFI